MNTKRQTTNAPLILTQRMMDSFDQVFPDVPIVKMQRLWTLLLNTWQDEISEEYNRMQRLGSMGDEE